MLTGRTRHVLAGAITITIFTAAVYVGVQAATGAFAPRYDLVATFDAAGQGLIAESDVKVRGVNIGEVSSVRLVNGRAQVTMKIERAEKVPENASATIRPKTLFGEKFVDIDPGPDETSGPFLPDGGRLVRTTGGFELERILAELHPVLQAVDGDDLAVVLGELAESGRDLGPTINRAVANFTQVADVQARHAADMQQFLDDLALLSEELSRRSGDLVAGATDLNAALPDLNARDDQLAVVLDQAARLSSDLADVLEANKPFMEKGITQGGKALQEIYDQREQLPGLVRGLRYFLQVLAEVGRIELGDGTRLAAIKGILGGGSECGRTTVGCPVYSGAPSGRGAPAGSPPRAPASAVPELPLELPLPTPQTGADALTSLVEGALR